MAKSITKNTIYLTLRMLLLMVITFFTSRVVLDKLGVESFGIYNVVSSLAVSFSFFCIFFDKCYSAFYNDRDRKRRNGNCETYI